MFLFWLLSNLKRNESIYIKTDQIDGESDLKVRKSFLRTEENYNKDKIFFDFDPEIEIDTENNCLSSFTGKIKYLNEEDENGEMKQDPILLENTIWSGCSISNNNIIGLIIAVGKETRLEKNSKTSTKIKSTLLDLKVNNFSIVMFTMMITVSILNAIFQGTISFGFKSFIVSTVRFTILLSFLIPISLRLFLMLGRFGFSQMIMRDEEIKGTIVKNETIVDELGKIEIILSDKTGTITQNIMKMGKISFKDNISSKDDFMVLVEDYYKGIREEENFEAVSIAFSLAICNNVRVINQEGKKSFNASSPDEIAMVEFFEEMKFDLIERDEKVIKFSDPSGDIHFYNILKLFPFESARKRMGIIVIKNEDFKKNGYSTNISSDLNESDISITNISNNSNLNEDSEEGNLEFYVKGADSIMKEKIKRISEKVLVEEKTYILATEGLRTLVFAKKNLTNSEFQNFKKNTKKNLLKSLLEENEKLIEDLEKDLKYECVTGVKDLLQEDVPKNLVYIEQAKVKLWILTGDKLETVSHICRSTGLIKRGRELRILPKMSKKELKNFLNRGLDYIRQENNHEVLILDGDLLKLGLEVDEYKFLEFCLDFNFICFARCSPVQKYQIAHLLKKLFQKTILAVGDGGNDVGMIQIANVGVGIFGKEGNQAALAADFTITRFSFLCKLIFFHGRNAYKGLASISQFILHRGLIISWIQEIFSVGFCMISMPVFNGFLMATYSALFTILPVFAVIFDVDIEWRKLKEYLNNFLKSGKELSTKNFLIWTSISIYQAAAIFVASLYFFNDYFSNFVGINFTALIMAETFNIIIFVPRCSNWLLFSIIITLVLYVFCALIFPAQFNANIFNVEFFVNVTKVFLISWVPVFIFTKISKLFKKDLEDLA